MLLLTKLSDRNADQLHPCTCFAVLCRVADGGISNEEAHRRNAKDFKRLYGADKPKSMFF